MYLYQDLLKLLDEQNQEGINDALLKKHTHVNEEILDKLSLSNDGKLVFDGQIIKQSKEIEQRIILNAKMNQNYILESENNLEECLTLVQVYKFIQGERDTIKTIKTFNNSEKENFYYDENNILFNEDSCTIKNEFDVDVTLNDVLYETNFINKNEFHKIKFNKKEEV